MTKDHYHTDQGMLFSETEKIRERRDGGVSYSKVLTHSQPVYFILKIFNKLQEKLRKTYFETD